jgi:hypothetical protein
MPQSAVGHLFRLRRVFRSVLRSAKSGLTEGGVSSGRQPAIERTHSRAHAMSPRPGNSRRSSTTAENSPCCS